MKQLLVLSGKGGTGKTTLSSALIRLAQTDVFADCDVDAPNLHLLNAREMMADTCDFMGMQKALIRREGCMGCGVCMDSCRFGAIEEKGDGYQVNAYACEGCAVCSVVCPSKAIDMVDARAGDLMLYRDGIYFSTAKLQMGSGTSGKLVTQVKNRLKAYEGEADIAVIDGSPGIGCPVIASVSGVDMVLVVAEPTLSGFSDMTRILDTAGHFGTRAAVCVNKADINESITGDIRDYCSRKSIPFVGTVPYDSAVPRLLNQGKNILDEQCSAGMHIEDIYTKTRELLMAEPV